MLCKGTVLIKKTIVSITENPHFRWCFVMEYLAGGTIAELIRKEGPLSEDRCLLISSQIASALHYTHMKGFLHRDITSSNIMLDQHDNAKLIDFGLSQVSANFVEYRGDVSLLPMPETRLP